MKRLAIVLIAVTFFGCNVNNPNNNEPNVQFKVDEQSYVQGQAVTATLVNNTDQTVGFNLSCAELQRAESGDWVPVFPDMFCAQYLRILKAGGKARYKFNIGINGDLQKGNYRLVTEVTVDEKSFNLISQTFEVYGAFIPL